MLRMLCAVRPGFVLAPATPVGLMSPTAAMTMSPACGPTLASVGVSTEPSPGGALPSTIGALASATDPGGHPGAQPDDIPLDPDVDPGADPGVAPGSDPGA